MTGNVTRFRHEDVAPGQTSEPRKILNKVLVVDDSEILHKIYRVFLSKYQGCTVIHTKNGREAVKKLAVEDHIDLIILDINMPVMNGIEFLKYVRGRKTYKDIPIIVISTEDKEEDIKRGLSLGAKGYIIKPFKAQTFHNLIVKIFDR